MGGGEECEPWSPQLTADPSRPDTQPSFELPVIRSLYQSQVGQFAVNLWLFASAQSLRDSAKTLSVRERGERGAGFSCAG